MTEILKADENQALLIKTVEQFGIVNQNLKAIEELSELIRALSRSVYGGGPEPVLENIAEEMADVYIMLEQLQMIFGNQDKVKQQMKEKLNRLDKLVNGTDVK